MKVGTTKRVFVENTYAIARSSAKAQQWSSFGANCEQVSFVADCSETGRRVFAQTQW